MEPFVRLGKSIEERWQRSRYDERAFPEVATVLLERARVHQSVATDDVVRHCFSTASLGAQTDLAAHFGEPPVTVYRTEHFTIDVLFWSEGTTALHEHGFSGAFAVLSGSSIHTRYSFVPRERINCEMVFGELALEGLELLRAGAVRTIRAGSELIHSLFHLDRPSASIVVRTLAEPDRHPQLQYRPPTLAIDTLNTRPTVRRQLQLVELLLRTGAPGEPSPLIGELLQRADLVTCYRVLSRCFEARGGQACAPLLAAARARHGALVDRLLPVLLEDARKARLVRMRQSVQDPERRFLLAALLNLPSRQAILEFVRRRCPRQDPVDKVVEWLTAAPPGAQGKLLDVDWDDGSRLVLRSVVEGLSLRQARGRLRRTYGAAAVREQADRIEALWAALRNTSLLEPMFA